MTIWSSTGDGAVIAADSVDLAEVVDHRLRFRGTSRGILSALFVAPTEEPWRRLRLTYRRPGEGLRFENFVRARLVRVSLSTGSSEFVLGTSSESHAGDSDELETISSVPIQNPGDLIQYRNFFYCVEVSMRRRLIVPDVVATDSVAPEEAGSGDAEIPPLSDEERAAVESLIAVEVGPQFSILTPSPELLGVQLLTT